MGRAIDLFVTYRFLKLLTTPFAKTDAFKLGIIDENGNRIKKPKSTQPLVPLATVEQKNSYTILHKLVFNIKKIFDKVPGLRTKVGTYAAALFLLKDTFKESVEDPDVFEKELSAKKGDKVVAYDDEPPVDTILGIEIFPVIHMKTQEKIYVSLEDLSDDS